MSKIPATIILSAGVHALLFTCLLMCMAKKTDIKKPLMIDLSMVTIKELLPVESVSQPIVHKKAGVRKKVEPSPVKRNNPIDTLVKEDLESQNVSENTTVKDSSSDTIRTFDVKIESSISGNTSYHELTTNAIEKLQKSYRADQLKYIADIIDKNTVYPAIAEELGITGTVMVKFEIKSDGSVGEIILSMSSGSKILDKDAIATIGRSGPFPKPPIPVTIQFPLQYNLE